MATELRSLKLVPGTPCDNLNGYCDVFAICRRVDMEGPLLRLKQKFFTVEGKKMIALFYFVLALYDVMLFTCIDLPHFKLRCL